MKYFIVVLFIFLIGCGDVDIEDSSHELKQTGESTTTVRVVFEYITQIQEVCKDSVLRIDFASEEEYNQAIAQCTLENMALGVVLEPPDIADICAQPPAETLEICLLD